MPAHGDTNQGPRNRVVVAGCLLAMATVLTYANSFGGPFVFDDIPAIANNLSIRQFGALSKVLTPPTGTTVGGRPFLNLSFAINYALNGSSVWGYHFINLLIHVLSGLALFGVLRRTLLRVQSADASLLVSASVAMVWLLHPLQTEAVTYLVQRAESLVSLWYLLTFYWAIRCMESPLEPRWRAFAIVACSAGMATKEVMVSAPLMVLLYDRTFVSGSFRTAWRERRALYLGLFATWLLLAGLVVANGRGTTAGFGANVGTAITSWSYALTQCRAIVMYLGLALWPHPLVFDYGTAVDTALAAVAWQAAVVMVLVVGTGVLLWRKPAIGFAGAVFLALLAPSSSIIPIATQTIAEHRMYLALAPVVVIAVLGLYRALGQKALVLCVFWAVALGYLTVLRNRTYGSEVDLWQDTVAKRPENPRAHKELAVAFTSIGRRNDAVVQYLEASRLDPADARTHNDLAIALAKLDRLPEATDQFALALKSDSNLVGLRVNYGMILLQTDRLADAEPQLRAVIVQQPDFVMAHAALGEVLGRLGRLPEAESEYVAALRLKPDSLDLHVTLARIFVANHQPLEAQKQFEIALAIEPRLPAVHNELGLVLLDAGKRDEAKAHFEEALRLDPGFTAAQDNLHHMKRP